MEQATGPTDAISHRSDFRAFDVFIAVYNVLYDKGTMALPGSIRVIDSHTEGEPTRVIVAGGPELGDGPVAERLQRFRERFDDFRSGVVCEPRGSEVVVGALLLPTQEASSTAAVIFFNDVGYLGMCGHGVIGLIATLAHMGRIQPGPHTIETPVGVVSAHLHDDGSTTVANVPSYRYRADAAVNVPGLGRFVGDIAWGGNWFFLVGDVPFELVASQRRQLVEAASAIRDQLRRDGITGEGGAEIDHIEFVSAAVDPFNSARNFVLCPGASFDRSSCGTGTSAKMACLFADGKLAAGERWRQESILGRVFEGYVDDAGGGRVLPRIRGRAWITGESTLFFGDDDPFARGIAW